MGLLRQCWTLTLKNIRIALNRHTFSTSIRAFILPILFFIFLSYAKNIFVPPSTYGIGSPRPIRTLAEGLRAASGGRDTIAFVNNGSSEIDRVIDTVVEAASGTGAKIARLNNEEELLDVCKSSLRGATECYGAIVFYSSPSEGGLWNYTIRTDGAFGEKVNYAIDNNDVQIYHLPLQRAVDFAIANRSLPNTVEYLYTSITQAQHETNIRVAYQKAIISLLGVAFLIGMIGITYHLTGFIASERELGMSQLIEAMMPNLKRWQPQVARILSYHIAFDLIYLPGWIIMAIILGVGVFTATSMAILIVFHLLSGFALASFSVFGASFFKKAQLSGITMTITSLLLGVLAQVLSISTSGTVAILSLLFPSSNYVFSIKFMARYEQQKMATDLVRAAPNNPWALPGIVLWIFLLLQILIYPFLGAWVERYLYGTASEGRKVISSAAIETVRIQNFTKHYRPNWFRRQFAVFTKTPKETVFAVSNLTLSASKGHICVLLGANGSGKSTTLDAIAGLNTVTSGTITVDGTGGLGIAPQKNVLWPELTVEEHIRIFNELKSTGKRDSKEKLHALIKAIDLDRKIGAKSKTLSGGQKRKLQLGMMFTGGSAVCCVDEVSSGLDPLSRRKIWDILLAERGARTIILTTHFLDEADLLADQIAILSKGTLRAQGSSVELKEKLGGGYRIHLQTGPGHQESPEIEGVKKTHTFGLTTYIAPTSSDAAGVIRQLEMNGLTDYELSGPTIEDVFLQLADEIRTESRESLEPSSTGAESLKEGTIRVTESPAMELHSGQNIGFFRQAWVLFRKRLTILRRNYLPYAAALLIPIIGAGLVTLFLKNFELAGCAPADSVSLSDVETLTTQFSYDFALGPSTDFSNNTLTTLYSPLLPGLPSIPPEAVQKTLNLVDTLPDFNSYIKENFRNVTPAGFFVGSGDTPSTLAYRGNGDVYYAIFGQNIMDVMLTNISISTQYASFDIPWAPSTGKSLQLVVYFGLAMAVYPAFFSLYPTIERTRNIRGLEYSNGVRSLPLWLAYLSFDFFIVLVNSALAVIIFAAASSQWYHIGYLFIIFLLFGLVSILFAYCVSLFARTQLSAFALAAAIQAVLFLGYLVCFLCTITYASVNKIDYYLIVVHFTVSAITPMGSLVRALFLALNIFSTTCSGKQLARNPGGILQYGGPILYLFIQVFILFAVLLWYDSGSVLAWYRRVRKVPTVRRNTIDPVDPEIANEISRVTNSDDGLRVLNLTKSFGHITAIDNLTFGIKRGEVFALLGPNGAGKSTTISLIRGDIQPSKNGGNIFVENIEINRHRADARAHLGVCPQFDAMDQMTVLEHLRFYARIRGVPNVDHNVEAVIKAVGLQSFSSRMAAKLSGGNKRKLSLGIALIGNPTVLLLDEPSSGMDAAAKRVMWKTLAAVVPGRSLLLTTHSMEEADALADRAGIMAKRMLAIGSSDYLRHKHGDAYYIHLVMKSAPHTTTEEITNLRAWVLGQFPGADIEDKTYHGQIRFSIPIQKDENEKTPGARISDDETNGGQEPLSKVACRDGIGALIMLFEDSRERLGLEHYSVSPTTLDQVFLSIVQKNSVEEEGYTLSKSRWNLLNFMSKFRHTR